MYEHVYNAIFEKWVARKLDVPVWINRKGEVAENKRYVFRKKGNSTNYLL